MWCNYTFSPKIWTKGGVNPVIKLDIWRGSNPDILTPKKSHIKAHGWKSFTDIRSFWRWVQLFNIIWSYVTSYKVFFNDILIGGVYLIIGTYYYFIIPMRKWTYSFIYFLMACVISFYQLDYCFLMSSEICKEYKEYWILHQTPYCVIRTLRQL